MGEAGDNGIEYRARGASGARAFPSCRAALEGKDRKMSILRVDLPIIKLLTQTLVQADRSCLRRAVVGCECQQASMLDHGGEWTPSSSAAAQIASHRIPYHGLERMVLTQLCSTDYPQYTGNIDDVPVTTSQHGREESFERPVVCEGVGAERA